MNFINMTSQTYCKVRTESYGSHVRLPGCTLLVELTVRGSNASKNYENDTSVFSRRFL